MFRSEENPRCGLSNHITRCVEVLNTLNAEDDDYANLGRFYQDERAMNFIKSWVATLKDLNEPSAYKNNAVAEEHRLSGNLYFAEGNYIESIKKYSLSLLFANQWRDYAFSYALSNRGVSFYSLEKYKEALVDFDMALASGYPFNARHKLYLRRANCFLKIGRRQDCKNSLEMALDYAKYFECNNNDFQNKYQLIVKELKELKVSVYIEDVGEDKLPPPLKGYNKAFVSASDALKLNFSLRKGRQVIAKEDVPDDSIIFVEKPYAFVRVVDCGLYVCDYCCKADIENYFPCSECTNTVYCSTKCKMLAWDEYHDYECAAVGSGIWAEAGIGYLAVRCTIVAVKSYVSTMDFDECTPLDMFKKQQLDKIGVYSAGNSSFDRLLTLKSHLKKYSQRDYTLYAALAVTLTEYLEQYTAFFYRLKFIAPTMSDTDSRIFISTLLLRIIGALICNSSCITYTSKDDSTVIGSGIYLSKSMMNHSCQPNIDYRFRKNIVIVKSKGLIKKGEEVNNCYIPEPELVPKFRRQAYFKEQYRFKCCCKFCL